MPPELCKYEGKGDLVDKSDRQKRAAKRKERLVKQLRDNLKRRKQQTRARDALNADAKPVKTQISATDSKPTAPGCEKLDDE